MINDCQYGYPMKSSQKDLIDKIIRVYPTLSPKKKRVADLILEDYKNIFFKTAREIAQECQVSEPTVMRFVIDLGFSGYTEFLQYMKVQFRVELTSVDRLTKASFQHEKGATLQKYCENAILNLQNLMNSVSETEFKQCAHAINDADCVYVVGYRASGTLAHHFGYLLSKIREDVTTDTNLSWELMDSLNSISKKNKSALMIVIAFPRYPLKTIEIIKYAKKCNVKVLAISDNPRSPVITLADQYFIIDFEAVSFVEPFAHIIAFLGALVHEVTFLDNSKATACLANFDRGTKVSNEFFVGVNASQIFEYKLDGSKLESLWPQKALKEED